MGKGGVSPELHELLTVDDGTLAHFAIGCGSSCIPVSVTSALRRKGSNIKKS